MPKKDEDYFVKREGYKSEHGEPLREFTEYDRQPGGPPFPWEVTPYQQTLAKNLAGLLAKALDSPVQYYRYDPDQSAGTKHQYSDRLESIFKQYGVDLRDIMAPLDKPTYGGIRAAIPKSGSITGGSSFYSSSASPAFRGLDTFHDTSWSPLQQMIYGHLITQGFPVLGPTYKDRVADLYGPGHSPGLIGFGMRKDTQHTSTTREREKGYNH